MSMLPTNTGPDWASIWADLLRSTGRTLLRLDGSDVANGALTGLDEFEQAQERRRHQADVARRREAERRTAEREEAERAAYGSPEGTTDPYPHRDRSRLAGPPPEPRPAWASPLDSHFRYREPRAVQPLPPRAVPQPLHPLEGWWLSPRLPLGPDGQLNVRRFRR